MEDKFKVLSELAKREFNPMETLRIIKSKPNWMWSWGFRNPKNYENKVLLFRVSGHHHKGYVAITLNWDDTYIVTLLNIRWAVKKTFENVYVDELMELLDVNIERKENYDLTVK